MRRMIIAFASTMMTFPVFASGGLSCDASDETVTIAIRSGITRGMGSPLFQFSGDIEIRSPAVGERLRRTTFEREHVPQYWIDGDGLKLRLYRETETGPHGYVEAEIITGHDEDELTWDGRYSITVHDVGEEGNPAPDPFVHSGPVSCFVE